MTDNVQELIKALPEEKIGERETSERGVGGNWAAGGDSRNNIEGVSVEADLKKRRMEMGTLWQMAR